MMIYIATVSKLRMDRGRLIDMLMVRNVNITLVNIVDSLLSDRYQTDRTDHAKRSTLFVMNRTSQGILLGSMFLLLYVDSLDASCKTTKYADDLTMIENATMNYQTPQDIQSSIDIVSKRCKQNNILANAKKSNVLQISNKRTHSSTSSAPTATLNGETIPTVTSSKFLGISVDEQLSFEQHIKDIGEKSDHLHLSCLASGVQGSLFNYL